MVAGTAAVILEFLWASITGRNKLGRWMLIALAIWFAASRIHSSGAAEARADAVIAGRAQGHEISQIFDRAKTRGDVWAEKYRTKEKELQDALNKNASAAGSDDGDDIAIDAAVSLRLNAIR